MSSAMAVRLEETTFGVLPVGAQFNWFSNLRGVEGTLDVETVWTKCQGTSMYRDGSDSDLCEYCHVSMDLNASTLTADGEEYTHFCLDDRVVPIQEKELSP